MMYACRNGHLEVVQELLTHTPDLNITNEVIKSMCSTVLVKVTRRV